MSKEVRTSAKFERTLVSEGGDSVRYLLIELDTARQARQESPSALNIALVIDSSRSMYGSRLQAALSAAEGIVNCLSADDFISVVSFSNNALVHVDGIKCDEHGKSSALEAIRRISVNAGTNLSAGWFKGADCVTTVMRENPGYKNHVLILSDGYANRGTLDNKTLSSQASSLQDAGITVSAVGIGNDYSNSQLLAAVQYGSGRIHHAVHPPEIVEVVMGEADELRERLVEDLKVEIKFPQNCAFKSLNILPVETNHDRVVCVFGGLAQESSRAAVFRILVPDGEKNEELKIEILTKWRISGQKNVSQANATYASLKFVDPTKNAFQSVNDENAIEIAKLWQSWIVFQSTNLNRSREYKRLERFLTREIKYFQRFAKAAPIVAIFLPDLVEMFNIAYEDWDEASRKEIQSSTYTDLYNLKDTRSGTRKKWQDFTGEFKKLT